MDSAKSTNGSMVSDVLIVRADRYEPLVVVPLKFAANIAALAEATKISCESRDNSPSNSA